VLKALGALAVAEAGYPRSPTARADSGPLRRLNWTRARLAVSVRQEPQLHSTAPQTATNLPSRFARSLHSLSHPSRGYGRAHESALQRAPTAPHPLTATAIAYTERFKSAKIRYVNRCMTPSVYCFINS
jgi:hypothetical protein